MKSKIFCVLQVEYEKKDDGEWADLDMSEVEDIAAHLAINPNFHTEECGVRLSEVHVDVVDDTEPIDWYKLEYYPQECLTPKD